MLEIPKNIFKIKKKKKIGEPPGTLVYTGKAIETPSKLTVITYDKELFNIEEVKLEGDGTFKLSLKKDRVNWINVTGLANVKLIEYIGNIFDLHPLVLEDILNPLQRPKIEDFSKYIFIVMKKLIYNEENEEFEQEQISLILGENFVLSFQEFETDLFKPIIERIQIPKGRIRTMDSDYLLYALIDLIVDNYFIVIEFLSEKVEILEEYLVKDPTPKTLQEIYQLKKIIIELRKSVWPLRELVSKLQREQSKLISDNLQIYLRDIYDHIFRITETLDNYREIIFGMLDMYLSSVSNKMNDIMKVLTIISTVFIPLSFLAGFYGMNFQFMPEFSNPFGYPALIIVMIIIFVSMLIYFKKRNWI